MFDRALPWARESTSPHTKAYACLGLVERLHTDSEDDNLRANLRTIARSLVELFNTNQTPDWKWFEPILSYDNPRLSQALFAAYESLGEKVYLGVAEESMKFLKAATTIDGIYVPIGSGGWYPRSGDRALYDQQPIEAGGMVETAALAYNLTQVRRLHVRYTPSHGLVLRTEYQVC